MWRRICECSNRNQSCAQSELTVYYSPMKTFHQFLAESANAESLDLPRFSNAFPAGVEKADFLISGGIAVCEVKQIEAVDFPTRVQKLIGKQPANFKRDAYNAINNALSKANDQIEETKNALGLAHAVGIVVLDHQIPKDSSVLSAIDAAERKMRGGLAAVHAVLCLDVVNVFNDQFGNPVHICQCVHRDTPESNTAAQICDQIFDDYLAMIGHPKKSISISSPHHKWIFDSDKRFIRYEAGFKSETPKC